MRTTHYTPLAPPCPHGERTDRTTSEGTPLCPLCRLLDARTPVIDPDMPDWRALAAGDDTDDDETAPESDLDTAETLLASLFGQESGNRFQTMLERWTERQPEGMLF